MYICQFIGGNMDTLINRARFLCASAFLLLISSPLYALPVTVLTVGADWTNVEDTVGAVTYHDTDGIIGNEEIRWGEPAPAANDQRSGYRFDGAAPAEFTVETGDIFSLGDFTHTNQPVFGSITSAQLNISTDLRIGGVQLSEGPFSFSFLHDETTNACEPQPECANDLVSFTSMTTSDSFFVGGIEYTLDLIGFSVDGAFMTEFSTLEGQSNTAQLLGTFIATNSVPAPPAFVLLALGLISVVASRRTAGHSVS